MRNVIKGARHKAHGLGPRNSFGYKKTIIKMAEQHAVQAPALRERHPQIFNFQYSIINSPPSADPGQGI
jgi:hypothetical protein